MGEAKVTVRRWTSFCFSAQWFRCSAVGSDLTFTKLGLSGVLKDIKYLRANKKWIEPGTHSETLKNSMSKVGKRYVGKENPPEPSIYKRFKIDGAKQGKLLSSTRIVLLRTVERPSRGRWEVKVEVVYIQQVIEVTWPELGNEIQRLARQKCRMVQSHDCIFFVVGTCGKSLRV